MYFLSFSLQFLRAIKNNDHEFQTYRIFIHSTLTPATAAKGSVYDSYKKYSLDVTTNHSLMKNPLKNREIPMNPFFMVMKIEIFIFMCPHCVNNKRIVIISKTA